MRASLYSALLLASLSLSDAFKVPHIVDRKSSITANHQQSFNKVIIASAIAILGWSGNHNNLDMMHPPPAYALQEKNEVLCNTGFFTNVGAWYCTDIGNIGDEGASKPLSKKDEVSVDSLMSKFNFDDSSTTEGDSSDSKQAGNGESGKADNQK